MFSVIKGSETDLKANEIQLVWMKTLILQTCSSIMWFQYRVHVVNMILHNTKQYFKAQLASIQTLVERYQMIRAVVIICRGCVTLQLCIVYIFWGEKIEQCLGEIYFRQKIIYSFGLLLRHVICTRPIYDLSLTNLDLDNFTTDL